MSEFRKRSITAGFIGITTIAAVLAGSVTFSLFLVVLSILINFELIQMLTNSTNKTSIGLAVIFMITPLLIAIADWYNFLEIDTIPIWVLAPISMVLVFILSMSQEVPKLAKSVMAGGLGIGYITLGLAAGTLLIGSHPNYNYRIVLAIIILIWVNDVFAYLVGSRIGKTPLAPSISPKKTWEGTIGGVLAVLIFAVCFAVYSGQHSILFWLGFGILIAVFSTIGDLLQSILKRHAGVKDSGSLLPGHGGFFDRYDSFVCVLPIAAFYLHLCS